MVIRIPCGSNKLPGFWGRTAHEAPPAGVLEIAGQTGRFLSTGLLGPFAKVRALMLPKVNADVAFRHHLVSQAVNFISGNPRLQAKTRRLAVRNNQRQPPCVQKSQDACLCNWRSRYARSRVRAAPVCRESIRRGNAVSSGRTNSNSSKASQLSLSRETPPRHLF